MKPTINDKEVSIGDRICIGGNAYEVTAHCNDGNDTSSRFVLGKQFAEGGSQGNFPITRYIGFMVT